MATVGEISTVVSTIAKAIAFVLEFILFSGSPSQSMLLPRGNN